MRKSIYAAAAVLLLLAVGCDTMTEPGTRLDAQQDGKAAVSLTIAGTGGRTVQPAGAELSKVTAWRLQGVSMSGRDILSQFTTELFSNPKDQTLYLDIGDWDFTLEGYTDESGETLILAGTINRKLTLEGPNVLEFTVAPLEKGPGTVRIVIELPEGHGINRVEVLRNNDALDPIKPQGDRIVFEETAHAAGDYYYSFRLCREQELYGVVSELISVRQNLTSQKTYTLGLNDLNLSYVITYDQQYDDPEENVPPDYYRHTDAAVTLPEPKRRGYIFKGWHDNEDVEGEVFTEIPTLSVGDRNFYADWFLDRYPIAYESVEEEENHPENPTEYTVESDTLTLLEPERDGAYFLRWYEAADPAGEVVAIPAGSTESRTFYAKWHPDGEPLAYIGDIEKYLAKAAADEAAANPLPLPVKLDLSGGGWAALLGAIRDAGQSVDLDLAACTMGDDVTEFDPNYNTSTGKDKIVSLVLPDTATSVRATDRAFRYFTALKSVAGKSVTTIGAGAFWDCNKLETISFPAVITIGNNAFRGCAALKTIDNLPATLESIGDYAFYYCEAIASIDLSDTKLATIGAFAFMGCTTLTAIDKLPKTLTTIGERAIENCEALVSVNLSDTQLATLPWRAFHGCRKLNNLVLPATLKSIQTEAFNHTVALKTLDLSHTQLTTIVGSTFAWEAALETIQLPSTLETIQANAFAGGQLKSIDLSGTSIVALGNEAFQNNGKLTTVVLPKAIDSIGNKAFLNCGSLASIVLPETLATIGNNAFQSCGKLTSVDLSDTQLTTISDYTFQNCGALTTVVLPTALESIGNNAFEGCNSLASIDLTKTLTSIGAYAFPNSSFFTSIDLSGTSITTIAANAFKSYGSLTSIDLPETIGSIGNYAFENCPLNRFIIRNATPPEIGGSYVFNNRPTPPFYVPKESVEVYKAKMEEWGWHGQVYSLDDLGP